MLISTQTVQSEHHNTTQFTAVQFEDLSVSKCSNLKVLLFYCTVKLIQIILTNNLVPPPPPCNPNIFWKGNIKKKGKSFTLLSKFHINNGFNKVGWDMKSDVSVNADGDNPKRLNKNLLNTWKGMQGWIILRIFMKMSFGQKFRTVFCPLIHIKSVAYLVTR
jgi:hypothetical protein